jgi:hypothetical protein
MKHIHNTGKDYVKGPTGRTQDNWASDSETDSDEQTNYMTY